MSRFYILARILCLHQQSKQLNNDQFMHCSKTLLFNWKIVHVTQCFFCTVLPRERPSSSGFIRESLLIYFQWADKIFLLPFELLVHLFSSPPWQLTQLVLLNQLWLYIPKVITSWACVPCPAIAGIDQHLPGQDDCDNNELVIEVCPPEIIRFLKAHQKSWDFCFVVKLLEWWLH